MQSISLAPAVSSPGRSGIKSTLFRLHWRMPGLRASFSHSGRSRHTPTTLSSLVSFSQTAPFLHTPTMPSSSESFSLSGQSKGGTPHGALSQGRSSRLVPFLRLQEPLLRQPGSFSRQVWFVLIQSQRRLSPGSSSLSVWHSPRATRSSRVWPAVFSRSGRCRQSSVLCSRFKGLFSRSAPFSEQGRFAHRFAEWFGLLVRAWQLLLRGRHWCASV